jgi:site-specific recombinase XerD
MQSPLRSQKTELFVRRSEIKQLSNGWLLDCQYRQLSEQTIHTRQVMMSKFLWWLEDTGVEECGPNEIKQFLVYTATGHTEEGGRWGNRFLNRPVRPRTVKDYYTTLRTFFRWLEFEGYTDGNPIESVRSPIARADQIQPFSQEQIAALLLAARQSKHATRDETIILLLLDTGIRSSELCGLRRQDIDLPGKRVTVLGKGDKRRNVYFSRMTSKALNGYIRSRKAMPSDPFFLSERGDAMTRSGLQQLMRRLGKTAGIEAVRCSPHTFRHTCALWFLKNGGQVFALKELLGHTNLQMTLRYVNLAEADVQDQHRQFGAVLRLGNR